MLVRTSNPGAADVLDLPLASGEPLWERLARLADELGEGEPLADVGAVTGATVPEHLARMRELMPRTPFLLPGVGAQGGDVRDLAPAFAAGPRGRPRDRLALDRERLRGARRRARRRRPGRGRAPARARMEPGLTGVSSSLMARRSPARFLAPLALVGFVIALFMVVNGTRDDAGSGGSGADTGGQRLADPRQAAEGPQGAEDLQGQAG